MKRLQKKSGSRIALYMLLLVAATGAMIGLRYNRNGNSAVSDTSGDTIAVAIQYSPVSFFMDSDSLAGFDYSLLKLTHLPVKIYPISNPGQGLDGLDRGLYDMVIADLPQSAADSGRYLFTTPAYIDRQVLVQLTDSAGAAPRITSVLQLDGDTVYVTQGSPMTDRICNMARESGTTIHVVEVPTTSEKLLISQVLGEIPGPAAVNEQVARSLAADYPALDYSLRISLSQFQPWVLRHDETALLHRVNSILDSLRTTSSYSALTDRYFSE